MKTPRIGSDIAFIAAGYGAYKTYQYIEQLNQPSYNPEGITFIGGTLTSTTQQQAEKDLYNYKQQKQRSASNSNPFEGPVDEHICVGDNSGNIISVPENHQLDGTRDGKWIQVKDENKVPTGTRKDGGGHPREKDIRGQNPHGHVPGVTNPDGTPWLPIHY